MGLDDFWNKLEDATASVNPSLGMAVKLLGDAGKAVQKTDLNKEMERAFREAEDNADAVDPKVGEFVRGVGKAGKDLQNAFRAPFEGSPIDLWGSIKVTHEDLKRGDHIWTHCGVFSHHGLYIGGGHVIHYGKDHDKDHPTICQVSLDNFAEGMPINRKDSLATHSIDAMIVRAKSRLNENSYQLIFNNCEHFVTWCRSGD